MCYRGNAVALVWMCPFFLYFGYFGDSHAGHLSLMIIAVCSPSAIGG
jgi:hypothetical protein